MPRGVRIDGVLDWYGAIVRCGGCDQAEGLWLYVLGAPYSFGERARAQCTGRMCPSIHHPLIYPEFVHALIGWSKRAEQGRPSLTQVLAELNWRPHRVEYQPWIGNGDASDDEWVWDYPELVEAARRAA